MKCILKGRCLKWEFAWNEETDVASIKNRIFHFAKVVKSLKKIIIKKYNFWNHEKKSEMFLNKVHEKIGDHC